MFGYSEEQIAAFGLTFGVGAFMLYMLFIIGHLAWESKAGKFGTFVIFLGIWHDRLRCEVPDPVVHWYQVSLSTMSRVSSPFLAAGPSSKPRPLASLSIRSF